MSNLIDLIKQNKKIHDVGTGYIDSIKEKIKNTPISDIVDDDGNQYVDLVLEGGGVLGIALIGYTYTLEQAGIRFLNLAGTSAGSINALILASLGQSSAKKSEELISIFEGMDFHSFVDGGILSDELVKDIEEKDNPYLAMLPKAIGLACIGKFGKNKFGINPGTTFETWLQTTLDKKGVSTTAALFKNLQNNGLKIRNLSEREEPKLDQKRFEDTFKTNELAIIATDITTESKIIFPKMGLLYWSDPLQTHPKNYVRASMSIPLFFEPFKIDNIPKDRQDYWKILTGFEGDPPSVAYLVDGGLVSNFPIDVFHCKDCIPLCPTFGVKLGIDRKDVSKLDGIKDYLSALFDTSRHTADYSFLLNNEDYKQLIAYIDTSQKYEPKDTPARQNSFIQKLTNSGYKESNEYGWLDFDMPNDKKAALFALGAKAAHDFICGDEKYQNCQDKLKVPSNVVKPFDWEPYKALRKQIKITLTQAAKDKIEQINKCSILP
ncbi:patatin-like phospholipase family protein [Acinetobacter sp. ANC 5502]